MTHHYGYGSIEQFRSIVHNIKFSRQYMGDDESGMPILDLDAILPTINIKGTVKLHGTNAGVILDSEGSYYAVSKESVLSLSQDNAGFFIQSLRMKDHYLPVMKKVLSLYPDALAIGVYGEWCGGNIQKSVALNKLPKMFVAFGIKVMLPSEKEDQRHDSVWLDTSLLKDFENESIVSYDINSFPTYSLDLDLNDLEDAQKKLGDITDSVENECPVAKHFGVEGLGEGVVWTYDTGHGPTKFKVKGEKHKVVKSKEKVPVDIEKLASVDSFVEYVCTEARMQQGIDIILMNHKCLDVKHIGEFIAWMNKDIIKEELDTMVSNNLTVRDVTGGIARKAKSFYLSQL